MAVIIVGVTEETVAAGAVPGRMRFLCRKQMKRLLTMDPGGFFFDGKRDLRSSVRSSQSTLVKRLHLNSERLKGSKTRPSSHNFSSATPLVQT